MSESGARNEKGLREAVGALLAEVDAEIARRRPVCRASGRCCKFEEYGHRLYVTAAELAYFAAHRPDLRTGREEEPGAMQRVSLPQFFAGKVEGCPYQVQGLCTAREGRPLGCRIYFCDENAQSWQNGVYEHFHARLQALHEEYGMAYRYMEWRAGLKELI